MTGKKGNWGTGNGDTLSNTDGRSNFRYVLVGLGQFPGARGSERVRSPFPAFPVPRPLLTAATAPTATQLTRSAILRSLTALERGE